MADNNNYVGGCPDPFSVAELIKGERIDWSKQKDGFDTVAECFGVTKEGFMQNATSLLNPMLSADAKGKIKVLSEDEAEKNLDALLKKHARPQVATKKKSSEKVLTAAQRRKNIINLLLHKEVSDKIKNQMIESGEVSGVGSNDDVYMPTGMKWQDKGYFFNEIVDWRDICQCGIGDCYFLSALCSIVYVNPFLIKNVTALRGKWNNGAGGTEKFAPWHAIDFYVPDSTTYESSRAWSDKRKTVQTIVASEEVLVYNNGLNYGVCGPKEKNYRLNGGTLPTAKADMDSCWPAVYEKAYAKFLEKCTSDYPNMLSDTEARRNGVSSGLIHGGNVDGALKELLHTEKVTTVSLSSMTEDQIWSRAMSGRDYPACASIYRTVRTENGVNVNYGKAGTEEYYMNLGLYIWHVYSLLDVYSSGGKKYVVLRNPHGCNPMTLKNNPKVYHGSWGYNFGYNIMDSYRGRYDIYRGVSGNDNPFKSDGVFLMEISEFKRLFDSVSYYDGPALCYGSTNLVSEAPVLKFKVTNNYSRSVSVRVQYVDPDTGSRSTWTYGSLAARGSATIDLSSRNIRDRSKVRVVVYANGRYYYSRYVFYHNRASRTINLKYTSGSLTEA